MPARLLYIDVARGLGALLVVFGHNALVLDDRGLAFALIFSFHLPLFFFLSGLFLRVDVGLIDLIRKRSDQLLKPFFATFFLLAIDDVFLESKHGFLEYVGKVLYASGLTIPWMPLWFLPHLWLLSIFAWMLCRGTRIDQWAMYFKLIALFVPLVVGAFTITMFLHRTVHVAGREIMLDGLPLSLDLVLVSGPYFVAGYFLRGALFEWRRADLLWTLAAVSAFLGVHFLNGSTMDMNLRRYDDVIFSTLAAISGIYLTLVASRALVRIPALATPLAYIGSASLFMLIFHKLFQDKAYHVLSARLPDQHVLAGLGAFVVASIAPLVIFEVVKRVKPLALMYLPRSKYRAGASVPPTAPVTAA